MTTNFLDSSEYIAPAHHHKGIMDRIRAFRRSDPEWEFTAAEMAARAKINHKQATSAIRSLKDAGEVVADKSQRIHRYTWRRA